MAQILVMHNATQMSYNANKLPMACVKTLISRSLDTWIYCQSLITNVRRLNWDDGNLKIPLFWQLERNNIIGYFTYYSTCSAFYCIFILLVSYIGPSLNTLTLFLFSILYFRICFLYSISGFVFFV